MLVNLHALRFIAALVVLAVHTAPHLWASGIPREGWLSSVELFGFAGVDVFFVISGFIMWHTTHDDHGPGAAWHFLRRRAARIYSGYWPMLLLALLLWTIYHPEFIPQRDWWLSSSLMPNPAGSTMQINPGNLALPVAWTLIYEVYFYLAFGVFIAFRQRAALWYVWAAFGLIVLAGIYAVSAGMYRLDRLSETSLFFTLYLSPFFAQYLLGCLIGELYRRRRIPSPTAWLLIGLGLFFLAGWINARWFDGLLLMGNLVPQRVLLLSGAACAVTLWALGLDQRGKQFMPTLCLTLGGSTYTLYLVHTLWLLWLYDIGVRDWLAQTGLTIPGYWLAAIIIVLAAAVYYQYVERRLHHGFRRVLGVATAYKAAEPVNSGRES
ncbi:acyltransferase family protein [Pseudomonadota bacterium]